MPWLALVVVPGGLAVVTLVIGLAIADGEGVVWLLALLPVLTALFIAGETRGRGYSWFSTAAWTITSAVVSVIMLLALWLAWSVVYCDLGNNACFS